MFINEVQRAGDEFVLAIKAAVDRDPRPGTFVLSGSTRFLTVPTLSESLAGRAALIELWPFSVAKRVGATPDFLDRVFDDPDALLRESPAVLTRHEYLRLACTGGFPEVVARRSARSRAIWFRGRHIHFQDRDGREVDCVLETPAGRVVGVEVKAAATVRGEDFRHLTTLRDRIGDNFAAGVVFFTGERPLPFGDRLIALPISLLWGGAAPPPTP